MGCSLSEKAAVPTVMVERGPVAALRLSRTMVAERVFGIAVPSTGGRPDSRSGGANVEGAGEGHTVWRPAIASRQLWGHPTT